MSCPNSLWLLCMKYVAYLLNHLSVPRLNFKAPIEKAFGVTPDISALIQFYFYQPVMYLNTNMPKFPHSKELFGYWVGVAENVGDALIYQVLTPDFKVITRSTLSPANQPGHQNLCQVEGEVAEDLSPPAAGTQSNTEEVPNPENLQKRFQILKILKMCQSYHLLTLMTLWDSNL